MSQVCIRDCCRQKVDVALAIEMREGFQGVDESLKRCDEVVRR
jgi:hypothetical protein